MYRKEHRKGGRNRDQELPQQQVAIMCKPECCPGRLVAGTAGAEGGTGSFPPRLPKVAGGNRTAPMRLQVGGQEGAGDTESHRGSAT